MKSIFAIALALSLTGFSACQSTPTQTQNIEVACASASTALKVLTVANDAGKLTQAQQTQVISAAGEITPICTADNPPTLDSVKLQAFTRAVTILQSQAAKL